MSKNESGNFKDPINFLKEAEETGLVGSTGDLRISQLKLLEWIKNTNREMRELQGALNRYKKQFDKQAKEIEKQKEKLSKMLTQQAFTDKSVKILNGLIIGAIFLIVLSIFGIAYDLIRDNSLYDMYINKFETPREEIRK
ncbi:hypothetical protein KAS79_01000 [Candidatus Parcubacteria bacterium]|nr:hypothetical protein [Candidatus Parcubacteria bacterium]